MDVSGMEKGNIAAWWLVALGSSAWARVFWRVSLRRSAVRKQGVWGLALWIQVVRWIAFCGLVGWGPVVWRLVVSSLSPGAPALENACLSQSANTLLVGASPSVDSAEWGKAPVLYYCIGKLMLRSYRKVFTFKFQTTTSSPRCHNL